MDKKPVTPKYLVSERWDKMIEKIRKNPDDYWDESYAGSYQIHIQECKHSYNLTVFARIEFAEFSVKYNIAKDKKYEFTEHIISALQHFKETHLRMF
jgi:hypothetical protein